ncbi:amidase domain-containing protein [Paenibacillus larvae]|uniref:amidase domain-containing protein n=1 Tax=Paenibacillus larvae TaxID=1464 RepID=UPI00288DAB14|nr:amidase domain-containing protein [Paenibacillus larvae]MDT2192932.1 amidase domain-containing protein [Paenibacillus larvae]MDT2236164.1 amidase domain-containing protein [Paenibacillus larvae]MDT2286855.1 amidase domain-containing protein [Paenibacillus larvae]MDT2294414.1 amidase domain-containing protein [Paenibacillus larvae]
MREFKGSWILTSVQPIQHEGERSRQEFHVQHHSLSKDYMDATVYPSEPLLNKQINTIGTPFARTVRYDRKEAARYADLWWDQPNPAYLTFEVDCTNYVSQCLFAGGAPMNYTGKRESGWWYSGMEGSRELWSYSWAVAHALQSYLPRGRRYLGGLK